jgi:hypothetical protein
MASQRVCAKTLELVVGRSIWIASVAMVLLNGGPDMLPDNAVLGKLVAKTSIGSSPFVTPAASVALRQIRICQF